MKFKYYIAAVLFLVGLLLCMGSVGTLDYLDACGKMVTNADFLSAFVKGGIGIAVLIAAMILCHDYEFTLDNHSDKEELQ